MALQLRPVKSTESKMRRPAVDRFYLPQLDGLRFVAFFLVFFHHLPAGELSFVRIALIRNLLLRFNTFGWAGVDIFFCLSSFLITTLLLREQTATGDISLRRFYIRRALRIWPLYFLALFLSFLVFPFFGFVSPEMGTMAYAALIRQHLFPFAVFLGNFSYAVFPSSLTVAVAPLWSISVEEQFYLFWPLLLSFLPGIRRRTFWFILGGLLALSVLTRVYIIANAIPYPMVWTNTLGRLDPIIFGTAVALLYSRSHRILPTWVALLIAVALYGIVSSFPQINASKHAVWQLLAVGLASAMLLIAVLSPSSRNILGNPVLRWAGKLSYGFYVYHLVAITGTQVLLPLGLEAWNPALKLLLHIGLSLSITILVSSVSYYAFERRFLLLKDRFTVIKTRAI